MKYGERKPISKAMRQKVYDKYDGHCAYCGRKIKMREMQVDHIIPIAYSYYGPREQVEKVIKMFEDESINDLDNLMPAVHVTSTRAWATSNGSVIVSGRNSNTHAVSHFRRGWLCNTVS